MTFAVLARNGESNIQADPSPQFKTIPNDYQGPVPISMNY